jgi:predicted metal-dependent enzyme (double-stranded beta helix superfamily)
LSVTNIFDLDGFANDCRSARSDARPQLAVKDVLTRALGGSGAAAIADTLRPTEGGISLLHHAPDLTILHVVWAPGMRIFPHDHRMWAVIGIYAGREDNAFYRRTAPTARTLEASGGKQLDEGDVVVLGDDTIHGVTNPLDRLTGAIHVYGGDFVTQARSQWGPGEQLEQPYDLDVVQEMFADANRAWRARRAS